MKSQYRIIKSITLLFLFAILFGCSEPNHNQDNSDNAELYAMHPDGLVKIEIHDNTFAFIDTDCINNKEEIKIIKKVKDERIQENILRKGNLTNPRDTCKGFEIIEKMNSRAYDNLFHYVLDNQNEKKFTVYSLKYDSEKTLLTRCTVMEKNVDNLDSIFDKIFQFTYYTNDQLSKLSKLCDPQKADSTKQYEYFVIMNKNSVFNKQRLEKSKEMKLLSEYGSLEGFEIAKNNIYEIGCNPFTSSRVVNRFISGNN